MTYSRLQQLLEELFEQYKRRYERWNEKMNRCGQRNTTFLQQWDNFIDNSYVYTLHWSEIVLIRQQQWRWN